jgi:hypothetical protein
MAREVRRRAGAARRAGEAEGGVGRVLGRADYRGIGCAQEDARKLGLGRGGREGSWT